MGIKFFAVHPEVKRQGIGTKLLKELEKLESGERFIYIQIRSSTYQFYIHRCFAVKERENIRLKWKWRSTVNTFLFSKTL